MLLSNAVFAADSSVTLFNRKDLSGWKIQNNGQFSVEDGFLKIDKGTGWLRSDETFSDFTLTMEFRFLEENANSGIFVRTAPTSHVNDTGWPDNGVQVQCKDTVESDRHLGAMINYGAPPFEHVSDREKLKKAYRPTGEWQTYEITCIGETLSVKLNGELITLAISMKNRDGHIGIQGEHGRLEFRKIEVVPHTGNPGE
jgi:hypothetical protein